MMLTGDPVTADEALRIGLVTRVWPDAEFAGEWRKLAQTLARGATEAFALTKEGLNAAMARGFADFLDQEADLQDRAGRTHDYAEGVRAFSEKRPAKMQGR
jgi:2-(1,2-epoxy-1,2-dihydrophenyl)acetyl-CoA isomerase